ncbi:DUAL SPECIFICITY PHOSPHATASE-LIKE [Salix purpurea]|uniref:DUAL SPECIFICITY PHOSPHATASE-LIKE n=1 Tax=Salix purpurea TaxID=77065 RepID=A0A9Q0WHC0_SALPP|nr:DUAL SPECIFICITY PHOSPHATASE-LIKE [Salix purpurea]
MATVSSESLPETKAAASITDSETAPKPQAIYRCRRCRRIVASEENIVPHERGKGEQCFKWNKKSVDSCKNQEPPECSSIFVEPMKWMQTGNCSFAVQVSGQDVERGLSKHCLKFCLAWGNTFALKWLFMHDLYSH